MIRLVTIALMTTALSTSTYAQTSHPPQPPVAKKVHTERTLNGKTLVDDYAWLRERSNPDVKAYLEAENAYAEAMTASLAPLRQKLYDEIVGPHQGDRRHRSLPQRRLLLLHAHREGKQYNISAARRARSTRPSR